MMSCTLKGLGWYLSSALAVCFPIARMYSAFIGAGGLAMHVSDERMRAHHKGKLCVLTFLIALFQPVSAFSTTVAFA